MKLTKLAALTASVFLATTVSAYAAGGLDALQAKVNAEAAKAGVKAPDVRKELTGKAETKEEDDRDANPLKRLPKIDKMVTIEANGIRAIQSKDGTLLYLIDNGRFAFVGSMVDVWNRKKLTSIDEISDAINHIDLKRMGFQIEKTNHITVGTGGKRVTVFVDPQCTWCHRLMKEIQDNPSYLKDYSWDFVVVKVLGDRSGLLAEKLACAKTTNQKEKFDALVAGPKAVDALEQVEKCDRTKVKNTELQRQALNIMSVPLVITPDNRFVRGKPSDLRGFLDPEEAKLAAQRAAAAQAEALKKAEAKLSEDMDDAGRKPLKGAEKRIPLRDQQPANK